MTSTPHNVLKPIAIAEVASSAVSIGTVMAMTRAETALKPLQEWTAKHILYPLAYKTSSSPAALDESNPDFKEALARSSMLVKGSAMIGSGFLSHIPIQLAVEGHFDPKSVKQVVFGKSLGLGTALGSIALVNMVAPSAIPALQSRICPVIEHCLPGKDKHTHSNAEEICQLMTVELPSSVISGIMNYYITKRSLSH